MSDVKLYDVCFKNGRTIQVRAIRHEREGDSLRFIDQPDEYQRTVAVVSFGEVLGVFVRDEAPTQSGAVKALGVIAGSTAPTAAPAGSLCSQCGRR